MAINCSSMLNVDKLRVSIEDITRFKNDRFIYLREMQKQYRHIITFGIFEMENERQTCLMYIILTGIYANLEKV